jgi:CBS domain-containing protein
MWIKDILPLVTGRLFRITPDATLADAAETLQCVQIGVLVVVGDDGKLRGAVTRSDIMRKAGQGMDLAATRVGTSMSTNIACCTIDRDLLEVWQEMRMSGLRAMPVIDTFGTPIGVLDERDVLQTLFEHELSQETFLTHYIAGVGYR